MNNCLPTGTIKAYTAWYSVCVKTNRGSTVPGFYPPTDLY